MNRHTLPTQVDIDGVICEFNSDFRDILYIFQAMSDPDLLDNEKILVSLNLFYKTEEYKINIEQAVKEMMSFISMCSPETKGSSNEKPLYDWEQDYNLIVAPINHILGYDVRGKSYLHWWTFLSAFLEIGECTFNTYVGIRNKMNKGKKLEKYEKDILKEHRDAIVLKKKYDSGTQELMNEIMGYGG